MGPLSGVRVVELLGIGPGPFAGMLLADLGADVVRVQRPGGAPPGSQSTDVLARGQRSVTLDIKNPADRDALLRLVARAELFIDPFRPGVTERLGLGPSDCARVNPALVYGRMTGWGQDGPMAARAGHDIDYIARNGVLSLCGTADGPPVPPVNLLGDFGGGSMFLVMGLLAGLLHARATGEGQVVDAAMVDGSAVLTAMVHQFAALGIWGPRGRNILDGGAPFYGVYRTRDDEWLAVGAIEEPFFLELLEVLGLEGDPVVTAAHADPSRWAGAREIVAATIAERTRDEWTAAFEGTDACVAPVWTLEEARRDPHIAERGTYVEEFGVVQPAPAPRFSATPARIGGPPPEAGAHTAEVFHDWGVVPAGECDHEAPRDGAASTKE